MNAHIRDVAKRVAALGYVAVAPDRFHRIEARFEGRYDDFAPSRALAQRPEEGTHEGFRERRSLLIRLWTRWFAERTDSWHGPIGTELAYLFGAIANDMFLWLDKTSLVVALLKKELVPRSNPTRIGSPTLPR